MRRGRCRAVRHAPLQIQSLAILYQENGVPMIWKCRFGTTRTIGNMRLIHEWHHQPSRARGIGGWREIGALPLAWNIVDAAMCEVNLATWRETELRLLFSRALYRS